MVDYELRDQTWSFKFQQLLSPLTPETLNIDISSRSYEKPESPLALKSKKAPGGAIHTHITVLQTP